MGKTVTTQDKLAAAVRLLRESVEEMRQAADGADSRGDDVFARWLRESARYISRLVLPATDSEAPGQLEGLVQSVTAILDAANAPDAKTAPGEKLAGRRRNVKG
jgi:hypothetical protein